MKTDKDILAAKLLDAENPTFTVSFDPDEADLIGAFSEDALTEADAIESAIDKE
tara:strand:- start:1018 stop:1179 length:162 start_codon:yes stop_codon:yes gene_type:complete